MKAKTQKNRTTIINNNDPTRTVQIRNSYQKAFISRFERLKKVITDSIIKMDCFGLIKNQVQTTSNKQFAFLTDDRKITSFMSWLEEQEGRGLFDTVRLPQSGQAIREEWQNLYIRRSYISGIEHAREELARIGIISPEEIAASFILPVHVDRMAVLFTRNFLELKGVTEAMNQQLSRVLAEGLARGLNPRAIASEMVNVIDDIGIKRARLIAQTEVIRAHHSANIQEYRNAGIYQIKVKAEWLTAGDDRVCPKCQPQEGKIFTLDEIEPLIPFHPGCRCMALPYLEKDPSKIKNIKNKEKDKLRGEKGARGKDGKDGIDRYEESQLTNITITNITFTDDVLDCVIVGQLANVSGSLTLSATTATGNIDITGLPYEAKVKSAISVIVLNTADVGFYRWVAYVEETTLKIRLIDPADGTIKDSADYLTSTSEIIIGGSYRSEG